MLDQGRGVFAFEADRATAVAEQGRPATARMCQRQAGLVDMPARAGDLGTDAVFVEVQHIVHGTAIGQRGAARALAPVLLPGAEVSSGVIMGENVGGANDLAQGV